MDCQGYYVPFICVYCQFFKRCEYTREKGGGLMAGTVLCKDCDFATHDGMCLIYCKWTALDVPHECEHFRARVREFKVGKAVI